MFLRSLGSRSSLRHPTSSKVCKLCSLHMELGSFWILSLSDRSRYLKCFRVSMELGNTSRDDLLKLSTRKYSNLRMHASSKDSCGVVWNIAVRTLANLSKCFEVLGHCLKMTNDELLQECFCCRSLRLNTLLV